MFFLELLGAEPAKRGANPDPAAKALYALEHLERGFFPAGEGARARISALMAPSGIPLQRRPWGRNRPHGRRDAVFFRGLADERRRIPAPAARMMEAAPSGPLRAIAVSSASSASSAVIPGAMGRLAVRAAGLAALSWTGS